MVTSADGVVVIAAQCIFRGDGWTGDLETSNLHDEDWRSEAAQSLARLRALNPQRVFLSHDSELAFPPS